MSQIVCSDYQQTEKRRGVKRFIEPFYYLPNQLTVLRLVMGIVFFFILALGLYDLALAVFVIATITDFLDGYLARKRGLISNFGRIADPLVDKIIICGGFIVLVANDQPVIGVWVAVVIVLRELLIGILRGYVEFFRGIRFPGSTAGKWKMAGQCVALCSVMLYASHFTGVWWARMWVDLTVWFAVSITIYSGLLYLYGAGSLLRKRATGVAIE
ncbi:MAG: CDP-diacylglycerol--glycerol-3-phosphate 3-phosphatidyltransferase [Candidatus Brocadiales bacterium]